MGPGRRAALALIAFSLVAPLAAQAGALTDLQAHGYAVTEGDGYLAATRGDGTTIVAVGDDAAQLVRDHALASSSDLTVVLADDAAAAKAWAEHAPSGGHVLVVTGTPDGDPIAQDLTSRLLAGDATDALWDRARRQGVDVVDRVDGADAAGTALAKAGYRPIVVDLGDGPRDADAAKQARVLLDVADDGLAFHTAHDALKDDGGSGQPGDGGGSGSSDDGFTLDLILEADFWLKPRWEAGPIQVNLALGVGLGIGVLSVLGLIGGVKHVTPDNALDNEKRASMYDTIEAQPGIHLRELARNEDMNITSASWHIKKLEDVGLIRSQKLEGYKVFYPSQGGKEAQRVGVAMNVLRNDNARALLHHVADKPGSYQREIADELDLNHATVRWHLDKLKQADLVTEVPLSHVTQYYVSAEGLHAIHVVEERGLNGDKDGDVEADDGARAGDGQAS